MDDNLYSATLVARNVLLPFLPALLIVVFVTIATSGGPPSQFPLLNEDIHSLSKRRAAYAKKASALYEQGYKKYKGGSGFRITTLDRKPKIIISIKYAKELNKLPDSVLNPEAALIEIMSRTYTQVPGPHAYPIIPDVIRKDINPHLSRHTRSLEAEAQAALNEEIPSCIDWTPLQFHGILLRIVSRVSGRIFVGEELCRMEEYIDAAIHYTEEVVAAQEAVKLVPPWLRVIVGHYLPKVRSLRQRERNFDTFAAPVIRARQSMKDRDAYDDGIQWTIARSAVQGITDPASISRNLLILGFTAIHTTSTTALNALYNLAAYPEYIQPLREEIATVLENNRGVLDVPALGQMRRLDSFIKETLRRDSAEAASFMRKAVQDIVLSDGTFIAAGTIIELPGMAIHRDPDLYPDPEVFHGFRFAELRDQIKGVNGSAPYQLVSVTERSLGFGYGRRACAGRFFAANQLKIILALLLQNFDIKLPDGETERYANLHFATASLPDPSKKLLFKRVAKSDSNVHI